MEARSKVVVKFLPSLADFAFLMPLVWLFGRLDGTKTLLGDCDTGWHIRTGEWIIANGWVPFRDLFSFTKPGAPWVVVISHTLWKNRFGGDPAIIGQTIRLMSAPVTVIGSVFLVFLVLPTDRPIRCCRPTRLVLRPMRRRIGTIWDDMATRWF